MRQKYGDLHLHFCAIGGFVNALFMMFSNLVGFGLGLDGIYELVFKLFHPSGLLSFIFISSVFLSMVHVQFYAQSKQ
jgi:hypothetical protein